MSKDFKDLRSKNARNGLVEVIYGEHRSPMEDGGNGYSYYFDEPLRLGDVVSVPQTWLGKLRGDNRCPQLATVVSTYSDYVGQVSSIIRVVKNGNRRRAAMRIKR